MQRYFRGCRAALRGPVQAIPYCTTTNYLTNATYKLVKQIWRSFKSSTLQEGPFRRSTVEFEGAFSTATGRARPRAQSLCALHTLPSSSSSGAFEGLRAAAHRLFVNNVLRRVTNSQTQGLRRKTTQQLFGGNSAPFLALVGVSLASGSGALLRFPLSFMSTFSKSMFR